MDKKDVFRKKALFPLTYACVVALGIWGATAMIPQTGSSIAASPSFGLVEPAAGSEDIAQMTQNGQIEAIDEKAVIDAPPIDGLKASEQELAPLMITPDKPEIVTLDRDAVNVIVGSDEQLRAVPDTNKSIILIPKKPGATYFKALDADGKVIMQRHVIIGAAKSEYVRIRRACANGAEGCQQYSLFYCPDTCHEVNVIQEKKEAAAAPKETVNQNTSFEPSSTNVEEPQQENPAK